MRLSLKGFQEEAVSELFDCAQVAKGQADKRTQALVLAAPTASGKTVMSAALLELLLEGNSEYDGDPDSTFLWITDQPELNKQTAAKFLSSSTVFSEENIVEIDASSFNQDILDPGKLYFINTQKLGNNSSLVKRTDERPSNIWDVIERTAKERPSSFWLIIDEAHRGMNPKPRHQGERTGIVQRLLVGSEKYNFAPVPLIFGISATPKKFYQVLEQDAKRTRQAVDVSPAEARDSGLIKKYITVWHTDEDQKSDYSLLARAGEEFALFEKEWARHHKENPESKEVAPALVVQVEDGNGKKGSKQELSKTDLEKDIDVLMEKIPDLKEDQIAHSFQDGADKSFGRHTIRYVAPSDIEAATDIRVIFFKMSLTTGWDCPRAEVIFSHRGAKDETYIAQLLGRMVRAPLAYEVSSPEKLSGVTLFLPSYNQDTVTSVVDRLREDDPEGGVPANDVQIGNTLQMLHRSKDKSHQEVFAQIETLPAFKVERVPELKPVRRLLQLGDRLAIDGIDAKAKERYEKSLFNSIEAELKKLQEDPERYKSIIDELDVIDIAGQTFAPNDGEQDVQEEKAKVETHSINIDDSFKLAGRKLSAGYQDKYLKQRAEADPKESVASIKKDFIAVVLDDISLAQIEDKAQVLCDKDLEKFNAEINKTLSKDEISKYRAIRQQAAKPFPDPWTLPEGPIEAKKGAEVWEKHLFVTNDKEYSGTFTELEKAVLEADIPAEDCVGWLRNEDRRSWAFSLVYDLNGEKKNMYPDFLFFRKEGKHIVVDIVEPHTTSKSDSLSKAQGLAEFAAEHGDDYGRIEFIDFVGTGKNKKLARINLKDAKIQKRVKSIDTSDALADILAENISE